MQFVLAPFVEFGLNFGAAVIDVADGQHPRVGNDRSFGESTQLRRLHRRRATAWRLAQLHVRGGGNFATSHNLLMDPSTNEYEKSTNTQSYVAAQYLFYRQLYFKVVGGYAKSHFQNLNTPLPTTTTCSASAFA